MQYAKTADNSPKLDANGIKKSKNCQDINLPCPHRGQHHFMAINAISAAHAKGTITAASALAWLLDYAATYPDDTVRYEASQMILRIHSDAYYQSETESCSRAGGNLFLGSPNYKDTKENNSTIHTTCEIIKT